MREVETFLHELPRLEDVGPRLEDHHDGGEPKDGFGTDRLEEGQAVERILQGHGDERIDLLGGKAGCLRLHLDEGGANSGKTSRGAFFVALTPTNKSATAAATTSTRMFSAQETMEFSMRGGLVGLLACHELRAEELGGSVGDDLRANRWAARQTASLPESRAT